MGQKTSSGSAIRIHGYGNIDEMQEDDDEDSMDDDIDEDDHEIVDQSGDKVEDEFVDPSDDGEQGEEEMDEVPRQGMPIIVIGGDRGNL